MKNNKLTIWILGAGRFGKRAAKVLRDIHPRANITIVDRNEKSLRQLKNLADRTICEDGIDFLTNSLKNPDHPDWIVPTIPIHVAFEWMRRHLTNIYRLELLNIPLPVLNVLPNPVIDTTMRSTRVSRILYVRRIARVWNMNVRIPVNQDRFSSMNSWLRFNIKTIDPLSSRANNWRQG